VPGFFGRQIRKRLEARRSPVAGRTELGNATGALLLTRVNISIVGIAMATIAESEDWIFHPSTGVKYLLGWRIHRTGGAQRRRR